MKPTQKLSSKSHINGAFGIFLCAWIVLAVTLAGVLSNGVYARDAFARWLGGSIGGLALLGIGYYGFVVFTAWENLHRKNHQLESDNKAMRAIIHNEARKHNLL